MGNLRTNQEHFGEIISRVLEHIRHLKEKRIALFQSQPFRRRPLRLHHRLQGGDISLVFGLHRD